MSVWMAPQVLALVQAHLAQLAQRFSVNSRLRSTHVPLAELFSVNSLKVLSTHVPLLQVHHDHIQELASQIRHPLVRRSKLICKSFAARSAPSPTSLVYQLEEAIKARARHSLVMPFCTR